MSNPPLTGITVPSRSQLQLVAQANHLEGFISNQFHSFHTVLTISITVLFLLGHGFYIKVLKLCSLQKFKVRMKQLISKEQLSVLPRTQVWSSWYRHCAQDHLL